MRKLSDKLRERLAGQRSDNPPPLLMSHFVRVDWPVDGGGEETVRRCYSTLSLPVTLDGNRYDGKDRLLDFDEGELKEGIVMLKDDLIYGASCGFRALDKDGLARKVVDTANVRGDFPTIYCEAWMYLSDDAAEIEGGRYGEMLFGGYATRIEMQARTEGFEVAKVWGGHEGIAASRARPARKGTASALGRSLSWSRRMARLLREAGAPR